MQNVLKRKNMYFVKKNGITNFFIQKFIFRSFCIFLYANCAKNIFFLAMPIRRGGGGEKKRACQKKNFLPFFFFFQFKYKKFKNN